MKINKYSVTKMKIVILSLDSIKNVGDELLGTTTKYLVQSISKDNEVALHQLMPRYTMLCRSYPLSLFAIPFNYLAQHVKHKKLCHYLWKITYRTKYHKYYNDVIKNVDRIILPVGMLKFATQNFSYIFYMINKCASKYEVPVLMSAMSVAKPDTSDIRYHQLVKAVNMPAVKSITSRDGMGGGKKINKTLHKA